MKFFLILCACLIPVYAQGSAANSCDLNADGIVDKVDVDMAVSMALGTTACKANVAGPGVCNAVVVQRIVNAALNGTCALSDGSHAAQLNWSASTSAGVVGYHVFRAATSGGPYTQLTSTPIAGTAYLDTTAQAGKTYFYVVTAVDATNNSSPYSNEASAVVPTP